MCGISVIYNYRERSPVGRAEMGRMLDQMKRRGPDGSGEWYGSGGAIGLGHRRLAIIDLSEAGAQPMASADGQVIVTFNGEIYNYRELRTELEAKGRQFRSQSDTEVLLHLYQLEGPAMLAKLRGMYALAIWDETKRGLFLARGPFGIKPLYYSDDGRTFRAASQVKTLLATKAIAQSPEAAGHVGFFLWGHVPEPYTLFKGIQALPAGSWMWVNENGATRPKVFWSVTEVFARAEAERGEPGPLTPSLSPSEGERVPSRRERGCPAATHELLRAALLDSVQHHLIADVPVGVFLSSGLDSTTLLALAAESQPKLHTVTLGFEEFRGTPDDEAPLAARVAAQYGAVHQTVWVTKQDFRDHFTRLLEAMDQPSNDGVNSFFVSLAAARAGLKVALSGVGGDELFGSYPSFHQVPRSVRLLGSFSVSPFQPLGRSFRVLAAPLLKRFISPKYAGLLEYGGTYGGAYLVRRGMFMPWELPGLLDADLVREGWEKLQTLCRLEDTTKDVADPYLKVSALEMSWYMRNQLLRDTDWASMHHSLEIRTPLVDSELLLKLTVLLLTNPRPDKWAMAQTPRQPLPAEIMARRKTGFVVPVRDWLMDDAMHLRNERGLRGWCKLVYAALAGSHGCSPSLPRAAISVRLPAPRHSNKADRKLKATPLTRRGGTLSPCEGERDGVRGVRALPDSLSPARSPHKILVFRIGQLGDTVVALPAMWAIRNCYPEAELTLLCNRPSDKRHVLSRDLLQGAGLFERFEFYPVHDGLSGRLRRAPEMLCLLARLRRSRYDTLVYLSPLARSPNQIVRDVLFFRAAGIRTLIGTEGFDAQPRQIASQPFGEVPREADLLLERLAASGVPTPSPGEASMDLGLGTEEDTQVRAWLKELPPDGGRPWIAFCPGSRMPAKRWPLERFAEVGTTLVGEFDLWPVVFGGPEDNEDGDSLIRVWQRGYNAAGRLSIRPAGQALKRCLLYVGNDTGTMHLAAAVGTPCVAVFSARDSRGRWYPYGKGHRVCRAAIDCEGCQLTVCKERHNECLRRIQVSEVVGACTEMLSGRLAATA